MPSSKYDTQIDLEVDNAHTRVIRLVGAHKQVLDVGCATGYMAGVLVKRFGCAVVGVELDAEAAEEARKVCRRVIVGDLDTLDYSSELGSERFDVIICADVLEHLRDPGRVLTALRPLLAPDGYVVASIPNVAHVSVIAELLEGRFPYRSLGLLDDTHLRFFTGETIHACFERAGLVVTHLERLRVEPEATEFRTDLSRLPAGVVERLRAHEDSTTYQFIVTACMAPDGTATESLRRVAEATGLGTRVAWPTVPGERDTEAGRRRHGADAALEAIFGRMTLLEAERDRQARELEDARHRITALQHEVVTHLGHIGFLQDDVARRDALHAQEAEQLGDHVQLLQARLAGIEASFAWRAVQRLRRLRVRLVPHGSRRERWYLASLDVLGRLAGKRGGGAARGRH